MDVSNGNLDITEASIISTESTNPDGLNGRGGVIVMNVENGIWIKHILLSTQIAALLSMKVKVNVVWNNYYAY